MATWLHLLWAALGIFLAAASAEAGPPLPEVRLKVGVAAVEPFAMKDGAGHWRGVAVELWRRTATAAGLEYDFVETSLEALMADLEARRLDAGVSAVGANPEREAVLDFTHPFFINSLAIAVQGDAAPGYLYIVKEVIFSRAGQFMAFLLLAVLSTGILIWILERRRNPANFGGRAGEGLISGVWWAIVTMSSVGYGDKVPTTPSGRLVAACWMLASLILVSMFTAIVTSSLTVTHLNGVVQSFQDLGKVRVGVLAAGNGEAFLRARRMDYQTFTRPHDAMQALVADKVDAVVMDQAVARYLVKHEFSDRVELANDSFHHQSYAFALPLGSPYRKALNAALLAELGNPEWKNILYQYLGEDAVDRH